MSVKTKIAHIRIEGLRRTFTVERPTAVRRGSIARDTRTDRSTDKYPSLVKSN